MANSYKRTVSDGQQNKKMKEVWILLNPSATQTTRLMRDKEVETIRALKIFNPVS